MKPSENFIFGIHFVEKCFIRGVLANFSKKSRFWDPTYLQNIFHAYHLICLVKTLLLSTYMTNFWVIIFGQKKEENWSKPKNFVIIVLITHFSQGFKFSFFDLMNFPKVCIFDFFERWYYDQKSAKIGQNSKILSKSS